MDSVKSKIIKEIAGDLDCGYDIHDNHKTNELISIPNSSQVFDQQQFEEVFQEDLDKINKQKSGFIKIEVLESYESFKILGKFKEELSDKSFQKEINSVFKKNPFQNFKHLIDNSDYRQMWFNFKQKELERIVEKRVNSSIASI